MSDKVTARIALDVQPEVKKMLKSMANAKGESMTRIVESLIRREYAISEHLENIHISEG
jgi:uncharacterized protein (DUF1778 family)